jgi:hypothetical protein
MKVGHQCDINIIKRQKTATYATYIYILYDLYGDIWQKNKLGLDRDLTEDQGNTVKHWASHVVGTVAHVSVDEVPSEPLTPKDR